MKGAQMNAVDSVYRGKGSECNGPHSWFEHPFNKKECCGQYGGGDARTLRWLGYTPSHAYVMYTFKASLPHTIGTIFCRDADFGHTVFTRRGRSI